MPKKGKIKITKASPKDILSARKTALAAVLGKKGGY
jgi:hypothetical protein